MAAIVIRTQALIFYSKLNVILTAFYPADPERTIWIRLGSSPSL